MTPENAFIDAIFAEPGDDGLRLIFADWLEERSDPGAIAWGEFIRLQVRLAALPVDAPDRADLEARTGALIQAQQESIGLSLDNVRFHRGFLAHRRLFLRGAGLDSAKTRLLARSFLLGGVTALYLSENVLGPAGLIALGRCRTLGSLTSLDLGNNQLGNAGARALIEEFSWPHLESLNLSRNHIGNSGAILLATSPPLSGLTTLNLRYNPIGNEGGQALAESSHLAKLKTLHLRGTGIGRKVKELLRRRFENGRILF